jgi:hypothetical protein
VLKITLEYVVEYMGDMIEEVDGMDLVYILLMYVALSIEWGECILILII